MLTRQGHKIEFQTLSQKQIEELVEREIMEYKSIKNNDYDIFLNNYIKASSIVDNNKFSLLKKDGDVNNIIQKLQLDKLIVPDAIFRAKINELVSELMSKHFNGNKLGEFTISDEVYGQQKMIIHNDGEKPILLRLSPSMIEDIINNFLITLNQNVPSLMIGEVNFNVWHNAIKSLACYSNAAVYIDTGIDYEHFVPYNIELTDISWIQNEKNIIDRVFCKKRYKMYQLNNNFNDDEISLIKQCYDINDDNEKQHNKVFELLHVVCPNPIPSDERKKYSIDGKDKGFLSLMLCRDINSKDSDCQYKVIRVSGYDRMPYLITRINRQNVLSNYGFPIILECGEAAIANSVHRGGINDLTKIDIKPALQTNPSAVEGGILNLGRGGINRAKLDETKPGMTNPVSILQTVDRGAIQSAMTAIAMNNDVQDQLLLRTERARALAGLGQMSNLDLQYLEGQAITKMSPMSSAIEAELKKPLLEFVANYFIMHEFNRLKKESKNEIEKLKIDLNLQRKSLKVLSENNKDSGLFNLLNDLQTQKGFDGAIELRFKEKIWEALTGNKVELLTQWNEADDQNIDEISLKLDYFWDVIFDYDNEDIEAINRFNIKSIKNVDLKLIPLREETAMMQDINLKIQSISMLMQVAQIDPESAKARLNIDRLIASVGDIPMMKDIIRDDQSTSIIRQQMMQMAQQQNNQQQPTQ